MKTSKLLTIVFLSLWLTGCEKDFLETPPLDRFTDETYWTSEENVETFSYGFYPAYFVGYGSGYSWGDYFSGESFNDDFAPTAPPLFLKNVPVSGGGWSFAWVRKANIFIDRVQDVPMPEEAVEHWTGVGRFFRGLEYFDLVKQFGDVPWYGAELTENDNEMLYKKRDERTFVMDKVLEDFQYAAENVRENVANEQQMVDRSVVLAYMSRIFLFEGTWQKYHAQNPEKAREYLEAAKWAAKEVIQSGEFSLGNYRDVFSSLSLAGNPEVILFREYEPGMLTHSLNSYVNKEPQTGMSKEAVEAYLTAQGLPIDPATYDDHGIEAVMAARDPRLYQTVVPYELRLDGVSSNYSTTGYAIHKFLNEEIADEPIGSSNLNPTDAPIIRYGEVLLNYIEAVAELATLGGPEVTQEDLDISVNVLRSRPGIDLPHLQIIGGQPAVDGVVYDDPERDPSVPSFIWEVRRERRIELMMEGFRYDDLRRWSQFEDLDTTDGFENATEINMGAWIDKTDYPDADLSAVQLADENGIYLPADATQGYIVPAAAEELQREFTDPRVYLAPIPLDQIKLYEDQGVDLEQNPGW
ncbi:RagB/SusD family nutrient uptake outer membrane protein [Salinimicrobium terrae]|uniref:RagB/SusD family nutrient uptake outer membrane protein n=1 Tax=Salinimicrobium terrae TaxID=470866 RepID=UPI0004016D19|nr:RagB/SusD family nutrient uptake outer membrane protein [Salinimicrobium terrae]